MNPSDLISHRLRGPHPRISPEHFASCIHCGALLLAAPVILGGRFQELLWNPDYHELRQMCEVIGGDCLHRQGFAAPCQVHVCERNHR